MFGKSEVGKVIKAEEDEDITDPSAGDTTNKNDKENVQLQILFQYFTYTCSVDTKVQKEPNGYCVPITLRPFM